MTGAQGSVEDDDGVVLINEFASVRVRVVRSRNGSRLEISSLSDGRSVRLDPLLLQTLTWSTPTELGAALRDPFGPREA